MTSPSEEAELDLGHCKVKLFKKFEGEDVWGGTVHFFGYPHHFTAIKVHSVDEEWVGTADPCARLEDYYAMYDYPPLPAKIPGLEGDFVILIHPHGD
jgi:hypothetical protein